MFIVREVEYIMQEGKGARNVGSRINPEEQSRFLKGLLRRWWYSLKKGSLKLAKTNTLPFLIDASPSHFLTFTNFLIQREAGCIWAHFRAHVLFVDFFAVWDPAFRAWCFSLHLARFSDIMKHLLRLRRQTHIGWASSALGSVQRHFKALA